MKIKKSFGIFILMMSMLIIDLGSSRALALSDDDKKIVQTSLENLNSEKDSLEKSKKTIQSVMKAEDKIAIAKCLVTNAGKNFKITARFCQLAQDLGVSNEFQAVLEQSLAQKADIVGETTQLAMVQRVCNNITPVVIDQRISDLVQAISEDNTDKFSELLRRGIDFSSPISQTTVTELPWLDQSPTITQLDLAAMLGSVKCFNYLTASAKQPMTPDTLIAACIGGNREIIHKCMDNLRPTHHILCQCVQIAVAFNYDSNFSLAKWLSNQLEASGTSWQQIAALWIRNDRAWKFFIENYETFGLAEDDKNFLVKVITIFEGYGLDLQGDLQVIAKMIEYERELKAVLPAGNDSDLLYQAILETTRLGAVEFDETTHISGKMLFPANNFAVVPYGMTSIQRDAFRGRKNLRCVFLPAGLTSIGKKAFSNCEILDTINLPAEVTSIGKDTFLCCENLKTVTLPEGLINIGESVFSNCHKLSTVNLPVGLTSIGANAFSCCNNLTTVNLPEGLTNIGAGAFSRCNNLTAVNLPQGLTIIGKDAFLCCENLTTITLPNSLISIEKSAFGYCTSLDTVNLPANFDKSVIEEGAFDGCSKLKFPQ